MINDENAGTLRICYPCFFGLAVAASAITIYIKGGLLYRTLRQRGIDLRHRSAHATIRATIRAQKSTFRARVRAASSETGSIGRSELVRLLDHFSVGLDPLKREVRRLEAPPAVLRFEKLAPEHAHAHSFLSLLPQPPSCQAYAWRTPRPVQ